MTSYRHIVTLVLVALAVLLLGNLIPISGALGQGGQPPLEAPDITAGQPPSAASVAAIGTAFTYQGNLKKNGQPVSATCSFQFSLWDALSNGTQKAATQAIGNTQVQGGAFTVQLDFGNQFTGEARWLETAVQCTGDGGYVTLAPRQPLNAVPYALSLVPGANVVQNVDNSTAIYGKGTGAGSVGLYGESPNFAGVYGKGYNGIVGVSSVPGAVANYGEHQGTNGYGVYGRAPDGYGTSGESTNSVGVYGKSVNDYGVYGESTESQGVYGESTKSSGVVGVSNAQNISGVYGEGKGNGGYGVFGKATNGSGVVGVSTNWAGVYGETATAGVPGVWAKNTAGGIAFKAEGNAVQDADKGGFAKAIVYVNVSGQIVRCYNGVTGASSANCGFTASTDVHGGYDSLSSFVIDFGFNVDSRFVSITQVQPYGDDYIWRHWAYVKNLDGTKAIVESGYGERMACQTCYVSAADFMIFVY